MDMKRFRNIAMGLMAFTSCSNLVTKENDDNKIKLVYYRNEDTPFVYNTNTKEEDDETPEVDISKNFALSKGYLYKGEQIDNNVYINPETVLSKIELENDKDSKRVVTVTLKSLKNGSLKTFNLTGDFDVLDPVESVKKHFANQARYKELSKGLDNKRVELYPVLEEDLKTLETSKDFEKYTDLDDIVGNSNLELRLRVDGLVSQRDQYITKEISFGDKLEDYNYEELFSNLEETGLKYSQDGKMILGGFDDYKTTRLKANNKDLEFITEVLDKTVGNHRVLRKIVKDGKTVYSKTDDAFVGFSGPTVLVTDNSFFDLPEDLEARTYRQTPYHSDPVYDLESGAGSFAKLKRTHGSTVVGSMIDELSYGKGLFWKGLKLSRLGSGKLTVLDFLDEKDKVSESDQKTINETLEEILKNHPSKEKLEKIAKEIKEGLDKAKDEATTKDFYTLLSKKGEEIAYITENEKIKDANLFFQLVSIGKKDGRGVNVDKSANYIPKVLDQNKNIKIVNMSYGIDNNFDDYYELDNMTSDQREKAAKEYNENPLYRFFVLAWLRDIKNDFSTAIASGAQEEFNALNLYDYLLNKGNRISGDDFNKIVKFRKDLMRSDIRNAKEFAAANHDVLFVRAIGNTNNAAKLDLTSFDKDGKKIHLKDTDKKYNNNIGSVPSAINYFNEKEAKENGTEFKYDYSYRKNLLNVVGVSNKDSFFGRKSTDDFNGQGISGFAIKNNNYSEGSLAHYTELVKEYNKLLKAGKNTEYVKELEKQIEAIEKYDNENKDKEHVYSLTRAGKSKLWTMAAEGEYVYIAQNDKNGNPVKSGDNFDASLGSSFAAPRVSAVGAKIQNIYPWMGAHQIKQTLVTTSKDEGLYGVDEDLGWGILDREKAFKGPSRFVKALTHETGNENFVADVKYGSYEFSNNIEGAFSKDEYAKSRNVTTEVEAYINSLPFEERELFIDAGLTKRGKGNLLLSGNNTYTGNTLVEEGSLIVTGSSKTDYIVSEGAKLKLDLKEASNLSGNVVNKGELYSYSKHDKIANKYIPYKGSKTYVSTDAKLEVGNLDLDNIDKFNVEVFKARGVAKALEENEKVVLFEAKTDKKNAQKFRVGKYPVSKMLTLVVDYKEDKLTASLVKGGYDSKATDDPSDKKPNAGLGGLLDGLFPPFGGGGFPSLPNFPGLLSTPEFVSLSADSLLYATDKELYHINGESLADSLISGSEVSSTKLDKINSRLNDDFKHRKLSVYSDLINEFGFTYNERETVSLRNRINGVQFGLGGNRKNLTLTGSVDFFNGSYYNDGVITTRYNTVGLNLGLKYKFDNKIALKGIISETSIFKKLTKDVTFANSKEHDQNQHNIAFSLGLEYLGKIKDKHSIKPYIDLENQLLMFDKYDEKEAILGLNYDKQQKLLSNIKVGVDTNIRLSDKFNLIVGTSYSKWLTDPKLNLKVNSNLSKEAKAQVESISLKDNIFRMNIGAEYQPKENVKININYGAKNLVNHNFGLGLKYTF